MNIRRATVSDAEAVAKVQVRSWQWAYRGLLPDDYLRGMSLDLEWRIEQHARRLAHPTPDERTWVLEASGQVVGFASTLPCRDEDEGPEVGEVGALYLAPEVASVGLGRRLFEHAVDDLADRGYAQATLWVLESNTRARRFYEAAGWAFDGTTKTEEMQGATLRQVRYRRRLAGARRLRVLKRPAT